MKTPKKVITRRLLLLLCAAALVFSAVKIYTNFRDNPSGPQQTTGTTGYYYTTEAPYWNETGTTREQTTAPASATTSAVSRVPGTTAAMTAPPVTDKAALLDKYVKAVQSRRASGNARKTVTTVLEDLQLPGGLGWIVKYTVPGVGVIFGEEMKRFFGQGSVPESGTAARMRPAVTLKAGDIASASSSGGGGRITLTLAGENDPGPSGRIARLTGDYPNGTSYKNDLPGLITDGSFIVNVDKITVKTGTVTVTADFSADGRLLKESIRFSYVIRIESMSLGTQTIPLPPLPWGELPGTREIVITYS